MSEEKAKIKEVFDRLFDSEGSWEGGYLRYQIDEFGFTMKKCGLKSALEMVEEHGLYISMEPGYNTTTRAGYLAYDSEITVYLTVEIS